MDFSWPIFFVILLLGILQVAMGVIIGRTLPLSQPGKDREVQRHAGHLMHTASHLFGLVNNLAADVDRHKSHIKEADDRLRAVPAGAGPELAERVLRTVAEIVQVNERLQTRLNAAEDKLQEQTRQIEAHLTEARTDPLTGLPNRRAFDDELSRRLAEWKRKKSTFCLILIDVDHFKNLNDQYGHPAGDEALRALAVVLRKTLREMDLVARIGGEEFGVVLPSTNHHDAMRAVQRVRSAVADARFPIGQERVLSLTVSQGLASVQPDDTPLAMLRRADEALYVSKRSGRNCGHYHDGLSCELIPLDADVARGDDDRPAASSQTRDARPDVETVCEALRVRLAELVEEG